jgi:hypothetical protein
MIGVLVPIAFRRIDAWHILVPIGEELFTQRLRNHGQRPADNRSANRVEWPARRVTCPRHSCRFVSIGLSGSCLLKTDRPERSRHNPVKLFVMRSFQEFETDIECTAFQLTREVDSLQLIFESPGFGFGICLASSRFLAHKCAKYADGASVAVLPTETATSLVSGMSSPGSSASKVRWA